MDNRRASVLGHQSGQCQSPKAIQVKIFMVSARLRRDLPATCRLVRL